MLHSVTVFGTCLESSEFIFCRNIRFSSKVVLEGFGFLLVLEPNSERLFAYKSATYAELGVILYLTEVPYTSGKFRGF